MGQGGATKNQRMRSINLGVAVAVDFAGTPFTKGIETEWRRQRFFVGSVRSMKALLIQTNLNYLSIKPSN